MFALRAHARQEHLLVEDLVSLALLAGNAVPFTRQTGAALAEARGEPVVGLVDFGEAGGQVLVLADVGLLSFASTTQEGGDNLPFLRNLARFAWSR